MARCYSGPMGERHPELPTIWLISDLRNDEPRKDDRRNDSALAAALVRLPRGSGFIFRHYHLPEAERKARFLALRRIGKARGHCIVLSGTPAEARRWGADGAYGPAPALARGPKCLRLVTTHSAREIAAAHRARADAILLSPVFPTRSHPGGAVLGPVRFGLLIRHSCIPVIALGGMTARRARHLAEAGGSRWAAIDGLIPARRSKRPENRDFPEEFPRCS